jgi:hypothetical protein
MMKKIALLLSVLCLVAGCTNQELTPEQERILGTWRLTEYCVSPGFGSCTPQLATATINQTLEFQKNGSLIEKRPQPGKFQSPIVSSGDYKIERKNRISFRFDNQSAIAGDVEWGYELTGNTLVIAPQCYEGCSYTYTRL